MKKLSYILLILAAIIIGSCSSDPVDEMFPRKYMSTGEHRVLPEDYITFNVVNSQLERSEIAIPADIAEEVGGTIGGNLFERIEIISEENIRITISDNGTELDTILPYEQLSNSIKINDGFIDLYFFENEAQDELWYVYPILSCDGSSCQNFDFSYDPTLPVDQLVENSVITPLESHSEIILVLGRIIHARVR